MGKVKFVLVEHVHLPGCMNQRDELRLSTYNLILMILRCQLSTCVQCYSICVTVVLCKCITLSGSVCTRGFITVACFFDRGEEIYRYVPNVSLFHVRSVFLD